MQKSWHSTTSQFQSTQPKWSFRGNIITTAQLVSTSNHFDTFPLPMFLLTPKPNSAPFWCSSQREVTFLHVRFSILEALRIIYALPCKPGLYSKCVADEGTHLWHHHVERSIVYCKSNRSCKGNFEFLIAVFEHCFTDWNHVDGQDLHILGAIYYISVQVCIEDIVVSTASLFNYLMLWWRRGGSNHSLIV